MSIFAAMRWSTRALVSPHATWIGAIRAMGRVPLNWRRLPPPPGHMPRAEPIKYEDIGMTYLVHSGKEYRRVKVTAPMVGHKYGEFVLTRKVCALFFFSACRVADIFFGVVRR